MKLNKIILLYAGLLLLSSSSVFAENFVCGVDLNGNGDIANQGETASCTQFGNEQFCSLDALSCVQEHDDDCTNTPIREPETGEYFHHYVNSHAWLVGPDRIAISWIGSVNQGFFGSPSRLSHTYGDWTYYRGTYQGPHPTITNYFQYSVYRVKNTIPCNETLTYSCPIAGNSCVNNNGIMQCNPNKCIDLDIDTPIETITTPTMEIDDGTRTADGACMDKSSLFAGRNLSCRKSGVSTAYKNCCKGFDKIIHDNTGSSSIVQTAGVVRGIYNAVNAGYQAYQAGKTATEIGSAMSDSIVGGIDPYSIAISLAIQFALEYLLQGCNQQDMESGMLHSSGYCVEVGEYCTKKWKIGGCVQKAKSRCCYNSKMARIIQEQGRPQLGLNFGTAKSPNCAGLTPEQFQRLDFSKIDMSEYYADIQSKADDLVKQNISDSIEKYYKQIGFDHAQ